MNKIIGFVEEVRSELKQVIWPTREVVIRLTIIVFVFSGIVAAYLGGLDYLFTKLLEYLVSR